jgi:hypothetical protein
MTDRAIIDTPIEIAFDVATTGRELVPFAPPRVDCLC